MFLQRKKKIHYRFYSSSSMPDPKLSFILKRLILGCLSLHIFKFKFKMQKEVIWNEIILPMVLFFLTSRQTETNTGEERQRGRIRGVRLAPHHSVLPNSIFL